MQGNNCILVYQGETYQAKETGIWSLNPSSPQHFERLFQEVVETSQLPLRKVVHLWSLEADLLVEPTISTLKKAQIWGCGSVLHLVRILENLIEHNRSVLPQLWLVTRNAVPIGLSLPAIDLAPLWGLGKTIALECPQLWGGAIDLAPETTADEAATLLTEIGNSEGEDQIAFRARKRYVARLAPQTTELTVGQSSETQPLPLQSNRTYLITGGLGALGIKVARWMVDRGVRYLVLTSRSKASLQTEDNIARMERAGAKILVARADVSEQKDMERVLKRAEASMPPLRGVIHAAGVSGYQAIHKIEPEVLESVFRPKVLGSWILHQLTQEMELDFFVSFSSIASVWGSSGQAHYGAANYFLDSLAYYRRRLGLAALTVNWGPWAGGGMVVEEFQRRMTSLGIEALQPEQALAVLGELLKTNYIQVTVAKINWKLFKDLYQSRQQRPFFEEIEPQIKVAVARGTAKNSEVLQQLAKAPVRDRHAVLIAYLQAEVAEILKLEPSQLPSAQQGFFAMGMDSLMAVELKRRLENAFGYSLPATLAFESPTIQDLAEYLGKEVLGWEFISKDTVLFQGEDEEASSKIKCLSPEELEVSITKQLTKLENLMGEN